MVSEKQTRYLWGGNSGRFTGFFPKVYLIGFSIPLKYTPCLVSKKSSGVSDFLLQCLFKRMHSVNPKIV